MEKPPHPAQDLSRNKRLLKAIFRAVVSMVLIGAVAIAAFAIRNSYYETEGLLEVAQQDWALFTVIFIGLVLWNYWRLAKRGPRNR